MSSQAGFKLYWPENAVPLSFFYRDRSPRPDMDPLEPPQSWFALTTSPEVKCVLHIRCQCPVRAEVQKCLCRVTKAVQTYRVCLRKLAGDTADEFEETGTVVVCKIGHPDGLRREITNYQEHLLELQGHGVPRVLGYFTGQYTKGDTTASLSILMMEDCGKPVPRSLEYMPPYLREHIARIAHQIHKAGLIHEDLAPRNVVLKSGATKDDPVTPTIVDFGSSTVHQCPSADYILEVNSPDARRHVKCRELSVFWYELKVWTRGSFRWLRGSIPGHWVTAPGASVESIVQNAIENDYVSGNINEGMAVECASMILKKWTEEEKERRKYENLPVYGSTIHVVQPID